MQAETIHFKIILTGQLGAGKSSLMIQYADQTFSDQCLTLPVDFRIKTFQANHQTVKLQIWDTAGQERFQTISSSYYHGAKGVLIVYDITDRSSFNKIESFWLKQIAINAPKDTCIALIGNKCDRAEERKVKYDEGFAFAKSHGFLFFEISSKVYQEAQNVFLSLAKQILKKQIQKLEQTN